MNTQTNRLSVVQLITKVRLIGLSVVITACAGNTSDGIVPTLPNAVGPLSTVTSSIPSTMDSQDPAKAATAENATGNIITSTVQAQDIPSDVQDGASQSKASYLEQPSVVLNDAPGSDARRILRDAPKITFLLENSDHSRPADVLQEVTFFGGGGDSGDRCSDKNLSRPTVVASTDEVEAGDTVSIFVCAWKPNEVVQVSFVRPSGRTEQFGLIASPYTTSPKMTQTTVYFRTQPSSELGQYVVYFEGTSGQVEHKFSVRWPSRPRLYKVDLGTEFLYGFKPRERIRVIAYHVKKDDSADFVGWASYQVDDTGSLMLQLESRLHHYAIVGDESGELSARFVSNALKPQLISTSISSSPRMGALQISKFYACKESCLPTGSNTTRIFPAGTTRLYLQWDYDNLPIGSHYVRRWTMDGREWVKYECTWQGPESGTDTVTLKEPGGLHAGTWETTISVDDNILLREDIVVEGNSTFWSPAGTFNTCYGK